MPTRLNTNYPRPTDPDEFESIVRDICALEWDDVHTEKFGRRGQKQYGVDVYGRPSDQAGVYRGAQCKLRTKGARLTKKEIEAEVAEARNFPHRLDRLILVTDTLRDTKTQLLVDQVNEREIAKGGFQVVIWFWDNVTERLATHLRLIVKYYPEFYASLTTLPIVEGLIDTPLQAMSISSDPSIRQPVDELLMLRGIRILGVGKHGGGLSDTYEIEDSPDGILCSFSAIDAEGSDSSGLLRLSSELLTCLKMADKTCPAFAIVPAGLFSAFIRTFEGLGGSVRRVEMLPAEKNAGETADHIFQAVFRYGYTRRGGLPTIDIAVRSRSGRPDAALLDMDWESRLGITRFPSQVEWQETFVPVLDAVRSQVLSQSDRLRIQFNCQLPLPAAIALGFNFNIRVARIGVWARRTGVSEFKQQFWLSDAQYSDIDFPIEWFKRPHGQGGRQSAIVELTSYSSIHPQVANFAKQLSLDPDTWIQTKLVTEGGEGTSIEERAAVAYANHVGRTIRSLNEQGIVDVHLFARLPSALAILIGQRLLACGRIHLYWFTNPSYQFAFTLS